MHSPFYSSPNLENIGLQCCLFELSKPYFSYYIRFFYTATLCSSIKISIAVMQLVRYLQGQDGEVIGDEVSATPKKIFQILHQVSVISSFSGLN